MGKMSRVGRAAGWLRISRDIDSSVSMHSRQGIIGITIQMVPNSALVSHWVVKVSTANYVVHNLTVGGWIRILSGGCHEIKYTES